MPRLKESRPAPSGSPATKLGQALRYRYRQLPAPCEVVLNLSAVKAFQSAGLATLARIAFDHRLKVVCTDEKVHRLLDLMGILPVVDVGDDEKRFLPAGFVPPPENPRPAPREAPTRATSEKPRGASAKAGERKTGPKPKGKPKS